MRKRVCLKALAALLLSIAGWNYFGSNRTVA